MKYGTNRLFKKRLKKNVLSKTCQKLTLWGDFLSSATALLERHLLVTRNMPPASMIIHQSAPPCFWPRDAGQSGRRDDLTAVRYLQFQFHVGIHFTRHRFWYHRFHQPQINNFLGQKQSKENKYV